MKKLYIPVLIFIVAGFNAVAQEKSKKELKGDKYAFIYSYNQAIDCYTHAKNLSVDGQRKLADSYYKTDKNEEAEIVYSKLINNTAVTLLPDDYYNYAMVLKRSGKYDEANKWFDKLKELKPDDLRAKSYTDNKAKFDNMLKDDGKYKIEHLKVNTSAEDFGASYYNEKVVFVSSRAQPKMIKRKNNRNGQPYLDMYVADLDSAQLKNVQNFDKKLNTKMHDGTASFNKDGSFMAYTTSNFDKKNKSKVVQLNIFFSNYKDGKWSKPEGFVYNSKDYSVGLPCLTSDGNTMYFASDMPGGFGKTDIYRAMKNATGEWSKPENMGNKINTEGDELFPYFEENNSILLFSSNGLYGLGGLDIFIAAVKGSSASMLYNAGFPLNTQYDDFAAIVNGTVKKGYFSSDRTGGSGDDDMYAFDILKALEFGKKIEGFAKDKNGNAIPQTFITLMDDKDKVVDTLTTKEDGAFSLLAESNKKFKLIGKKAKYMDGDSIASTFGTEYIVKADVILFPTGDTIVAKAKLAKVAEEKTVDQMIEVGADLGKILKFNPDRIYFELNKSSLTPEAKTELKNIVKVMNEHPKMVVELGAYTDCRGSEAYNQTLSDQRAKVSADFIKQKITDPKRIFGKGYGETKLVNACACEGKVVSECSDEQHQKNRRTEFIIVKE